MPISTMVTPRIRTSVRRRNPADHTDRLGSALRWNATHAAGFTIIEFMVAIALSLLAMAGLTAVFISGSIGRYELERSSRQIENGRYAMQLLRDDLWQAGYYAEFDPRALGVPGVKPDACATGSPDLKTALRLHVQGYNDPSTSDVAALGCLSDVRAGSDILVVRRASSCVPGAAGCDAVAGGAPYFQASLCYSSTELNGAVSGWYGLDTNTSALTLHKKDCSTPADLHRYFTHIYFVANNDVGADGIPTLKMAELGAGGFTIVPLVEGIENMQFEFGLDTNSDGAPEVFTANPDTYGGCGGAACMTNWSNAVAIKIYLLVRNTETSPGYVDSKTYTLGTTPAIVPGTTYYSGWSAPCDAAPTCYPTGYRRHVYQAEVRLNNASGRNSTP